MNCKKRILVVIAVIELLLLTVQTVFANYSNGPENPGGGIVVREGDVFFFFLEDIEKGLTASINGDVVQWCLTGEEEVAFFDVQYILSPSNENRIFQIYQANDVPTQVFDFLIDWDAVGSVEDICAQFFGKEHIAAGLTHVRGTDNDYFLNLDPNNTNAFGFTAQGQLYSPAGEKMHFNAIFRVAFREDGFNVVEKKNLK